MQKVPDPFYYSAGWLAVRRVVLERDRHRCVICGVSVAGKGKARVDHVQPRSIRPDLALDVGNCRSLCARCDNQSHREKPSQGTQRVERFNIRGCDARGMPLDPKHPWNTKAI